MGRRRSGTWTAALAAVGILAACTGTGEGSSAGPVSSAGASGQSGPVQIEFWHGQSGVSMRTYEAMIEDFNAEHDGIDVVPQSGGVTTDNMLPKVTTAIAAGTYPDIAYLYGSWSANIAKSDKVVDLTSYVQDPAFEWDDFWPPLREAATVGDRIIGIPAAAGNLTVVYNKALFDAAGAAYPSSEWTWDDFRTAAAAVTDPTTNTYGTSWPVTGDEDTVWRFWPLLWQHGGDIVNPEQTQATFDEQAGVDALTFLKDMNADGSIYHDSTDEKGYQLFLSGHLGMLVTGPWALYDVTQARIDYGVQLMPALGSEHTTVAGADNWVVFDHGDPARVSAAVEFLQWLTAAEQDLRYDLAVGNMPVRKATTELADFADYVRDFPGVDTMVANLEQARSRPAITEYPRLSSFVGEAIVAVLLDDADPQSALSQAAQQTDALLAVPS
jgi:multiple sugar transport system substrate-binding protein